MNWESLTPRERDALVAEKILGWTKRHIPPPAATQTWWKDTDGHEWAQLPDYTTSIGRAWLVVEEMRKRGYAFEFTILPREGFVPDVGWVYAHFWLKDNRKEPNGMAKLAPEAICLAALRALKVIE